MSDQTDTLGGRLPLADQTDRHRLPHRHLSLGVRDAHHVRDSRSRIGALDMTFAALPDVRASVDPDGPSVSDGTQSLTNAVLLERVRAVADQLHDLGVGAEDVVAVKLRNRVEFVVVLFAS